MATWRNFRTEATELAGEVRRVLEAERSHVLATLSRDGAPRVSGIEVQFQDDDLTMGSMTDAVKVRDLERDDRFALHSHPAEGGDAKLFGRALEIGGPPELDHHVFRLGLERVVYIDVAPEGDHLLIRTWRPGVPVTVVQRY